MLGLARLIADSRAGSRGTVTDGQAGVLGLFLVGLLGDTGQALLDSLACGVNGVPVV